MARGFQSESNWMTRLSAGERPSDVFSSKPALSRSPGENGRGQTTPGGCTVMLALTGRRPLPQGFSLV